MPKYLTISEGRSPTTATPIIATADPRVIRAALREVAKLAEGTSSGEGGTSEVAEERDGRDWRPRPLRDCAR